MSSPTQCDFLLLRYIPDPFKNEFVNIGVLLLARDEDFREVRFTHDWSRVRCLDPHVDLEMLHQLEEDIRAHIQNGKQLRNQWISRLQETLSTGLQISEAKALLTESPQQDLEELARTYLERPRPKRASKLGARQQIVAKMQDAFESAGVWKALHKEIRASQYTHAGDPLKIDCGYQPNGVIRLFHAVALQTELDSAKVLAFSYPTLSVGVQKRENVKTDLTAIVDDDLDREQPGIDFALDTLRQSSINIASIKQLPELAERARIELRL